MSDYKYVQIVSCNCKCVDFDKFESFAVSARTFVSEVQMNVCLDFKRVEVKPQVLTGNLMKFWSLSRIATFMLDS